LTKACLECLKWPGGTSVAVNLSSMQFSRSNVPALVRDVLAATNLSASRLELEITESTLLQDTIRTRHDLHLLERLGEKISLDDFGTAYSSLSYLHSFPFHKVKIDQSFLRGLVDDERRRHYPIVRFLLPQIINAQQAVCRTVYHSCSTRSIASLRTRARNGK